MVRPARVEDVPQIARLIRGLAEYERLTAKCTFTEDGLREHLFGSRPYAEALLAEEGGRPVGFALFFHTYSSFLGKPKVFLEDLFVEPEHRRKGHGRALLSAVARIAVERNCGRLEWSVLDWNEDAIMFYRSLGADAIDEWTSFRLTGEALGALARE